MVLNNPNFPLKLTLVPEPIEVNPQAPPANGEWQTNLKLNFPMDSQVPQGVYAFVAQVDSLDTEQRYSMISEARNSNVNIESTDVTWVRAEYVGSSDPDRSQLPYSIVLYDGANPEMDPVRDILTKGNYINIRLYFRLPIDKLLRLDPRRITWFPFCVKVFPHKGNRVDDQQQATIIGKIAVEPRYGFDFNLQGNGISSEDRAEYTLTLINHSPEIFTVRLSAAVEDHSHTNTVRFNFEPAREISLVPYIPRPVTLKVALAQNPWWNLGNNSSGPESFNFKVIATPLNAPRGVTLVSKEHTGTWPDGR